MKESKAVSILNDLSKGVKVSRWTIGSNIGELRMLLKENKFKHLNDEVEWLYDCCHY